MNRLYTYPPLSYYQQPHLIYRQHIFRIASTFWVIDDIRSIRYQENASVVAHVSNAR